MDTVGRLHDLLDTLDNFAGGLSETLGEIDLTVESLERDRLMAMLYTRLVDVSHRVSASLHFDYEALLVEMEREAMRDADIDGYEEPTPFGDAVSF